MDLYRTENDEFGNIYKQTNRLNRKLKRMADENGLHVEEDLLGLERERQRKILEQGLDVEPEKELDKTMVAKEEDDAFRRKLEEEV